MKNNQQRSIDMMAYGIKTIVQSSQDTIDWYMNEFTIQPDAKFGGGIGKVMLLNYLEQCISIEDDYFNETPFAQIECPQRWQDYLDDCVAFACLHSFMNDIEVPVIEAEVALENLDMVLKLLSEHNTVNHLRTFGKNATH